MTTLVALLAAISGAILGDRAKGERKTDPWQLKVGSHYEVATKEVVSKGRRSWKIYVGTVQEINDDSVTLVDVSMTSGVDQSTPVLSRIPYLNRLFKTVGIGRSHLGDETVTIPFKDIARREEVDELNFQDRTAGARNNMRKRGLERTRS
jgi:hypothetical protein